MPTYKASVEAQDFWHSPEDKLYSIAATACGLSIGRNVMCQLPVKRLTIYGEKCYRKKDILDWLQRDSKSEDPLYESLRAKFKSQLLGRRADAVLNGACDFGLHLLWETRNGLSKVPKQERRQQKFDLLPRELKRSHKVRAKFKIKPVRERNANNKDTVKKAQKKKAVSID